MGSEDIEVQCHQQSAAVSDSCDSSTTIGIATIPYSLTDPTGQQMSVTYSQAGTPTPVTGGTAILAQSASHTPPQNVAVQPSVPQSPLPHVQVIQQPLQNQYLQHLYAPQQQHMFLPGNLTIQPAIQGLGGPGLSLQLQGKPLENKGGGQTILSAAPMQAAGNFSGQNLMSAGGQMIATGAKTCVQGQMLTASSKSTAVIQGQSTFIPSTTANQTVVIGQLGVLANQPSMLPHQAKALSDSQKNKSFLISQPATLHPKSPILPSPNASCGGQMVPANQLKQIQSAPHIISSQAPTMIASQAQILERNNGFILGSLQALGASLPQGITWATPGSLHSPALFGQNPIFIRSQQSDMFIQTPPPQATIHAVPVAAAAATPTAPTAAVPATAPPTASPATAVAATSTPPQQQPQNVVQPVPPPQKLKPVRPASSVATQTAVSTTSSTNQHTSTTKSMAKQKSRSQQLRSSPALTSSTQLQTATTQTQTNLPTTSHKADAANQTTSRISHEPKAPSIQHKSASTETRFAVLEQPKIEKPVVMQEVRPTMASPVVCNNVVPPPTVNNVSVVDTTVSGEPEETSMDVDESFQEQDSPENSVENAGNKDQETEMESIGIVAPLPETVVKDHVKHPQKAIVKPHVLTHVIEGFVIQEGSEPFPVGRPLMQNGTPSKHSNSERAVGVSSPMPAISDVSAVLPKKKEKVPKIRGPVELAKCEFCGKLGPKSKFKRSKRFCSTSCAKRFNVGCSKRHSSALSESDHKNSVSGKSAKKKKLGFKKKGWRKSQSRSFEISKWAPQPELTSAENVNSTIAEEKTAENNIDCSNFDISNAATEVENVEPAIAPCSEIMETEKEITHSTLEFATKSPLKWTVTDVVDFIRNLPGCSDYADEFRAQEIDGQALMLLKEDHLMSTMSMKLGPALKVCAKINSLKDEINH